MSFLSSAAIDRSVKNQIIINKAVIMVQTETVSWREARTVIKELLIIISQQKLAVVGTSSSRLKEWFKKWSTSSSS